VSLVLVWGACRFAVGLLQVTCYPGPLLVVDLTGEVLKLGTVRDVAGLDGGCCDRHVGGAKHQVRDIRNLRTCYKLVIPWTAVGGEVPCSGVLLCFGNLGSTFLAMERTPPG
jgi:hypothetical protein